MLVEPLIFVVDQMVMIGENWKKSSERDTVQKTKTIITIAATERKYKNNHHNCCNRTQIPRAPKTAKFVKGRTRELKKHIHDVGVQNQADMFTNTTSKIVNYAGRHCKDHASCIDY